MSDEARFVLDTNILISALLFKQGKPSRAVGRALDRGRVMV